MTEYNFDRPVDRRPSESLKWKTYDPDILPMWVADMDFQVPPSIIEALKTRIDHGIFGYELPSQDLRQTICDRLFRLYRWKVTPEQIVFSPGVVSSFNLACRAVANAGESILSHIPVYPPILKAPTNQKMRLVTAELAHYCEGQLLHYEIDFEAMQSAVCSDTRLFILCHPQNPTGIEFSAADLTRLAEFCFRQNLWICSDEIHCDLLLDGTIHTPLASLSPEVASRTITLMAPSKTYNIPGLGCSFAIISNPEMRRRFKNAGEGILPWVNSLGLVATQAAFQFGDEWLEQLRKYLTINRNLLIESLAKDFPYFHCTSPQATYLAWIDCRQAPFMLSPKLESKARGEPGPYRLGRGETDPGHEDNPHEFFLKRARVAFNDGAPFGNCGEGFIRLNFGCPRSRLEEALCRMKRALVDADGQDSYG
jgi:cystathionine beta-lyase